MRSKISALVCAPIVFGATVLYAEVARAEDLSRMRVAVAGLDVRSTTGADAVLRRIRTASDQFCDNRADNRSLQQRARAQACAKRMAFLAVRELDAPLVTARYDGRREQAVLLARR